MKRLIVIAAIWILTVAGIFTTQNIYALGVPPRSQAPKIFTNDQAQIIDSTITSSENPIRQGVSDVADNLNLGDNEVGIDDFDGALSKVGYAVQGVINYILGFLALIALIILIYDGYILLFSANDEAATKKARGSVRIVAYSLIGIGLSWLIVSGIFWVVSVLSAS